MWRKFKVTYINSSGMLAEKEIEGYWNTVLSSFTNSVYIAEDMILKIEVLPEIDT